jgi:hypothetical protein
MRRLWIASKGDTTYPGVEVPEPPPVISEPFCRSEVSTVLLVHSMYSMVSLFVCSHSIAAQSCSSETYLCVPAKVYFISTTKSCRILPRRVSDTRIVTIHAQVFRVLKRKRVVNVLHQNRSGSSNFADERCVVATSFHNGPLLGVWCNRNLRVALILAYKVPSGKNAGDHVVETGLCNTSVVHSFGEVGAPEGTVRHNEIHASISSCHTRVLCPPV